MLNAPAILVARFTAAGFHHWPDATPARSYLSHPHRHLFHVEVRIRAHHDQREVEFHDLLETARHFFTMNGTNHGTNSCETMARELVAHLESTYSRPAGASVFEDGEVGAIIELPPIENPEVLDALGLAPMG